LPSQEQEREGEEGTHRSRSSRQCHLRQRAREPAKQGQEARLGRARNDLVDRARLLDGELPQRVERERRRDRDEAEQDGERDAVGAARQARKVARDAVVDEDGAERAVEEDLERVARRERTC